MEYIVGAVLALIIGLSGSLIGFERDRAFYPVVTIVIASYYLLFAAIAGSSSALIAESAFLALFAGLSIAAFRSTLWLAVVALGTHGLLDFVHANIVTNPGVPEWWPAFCLAYDLVAAGYLALRLRGHQVSARRAPARF